MLIHIPNWFFVLNVLTACFGVVYFFTQACGAACDDSKTFKLMIVGGFAVCGVTLFFSIAMLSGIIKYSSMFLFFSWFAVFMSAPFLRKPRILSSSAPEKAEDLALIEKPHPHDQKQLSMARGRHE